MTDIPEFEVLMSSDTVEDIERINKTILDTIAKRDAMEKLAETARAGVVKAILTETYWRLDNVVGGLEYELARAKGEV